jgi:alpha-soluble NSF attachment protein
MRCAEGFDARGVQRLDADEYDRVSKLDPWKTSILVKVKRTIDDDAGDDDGDDVDLT